MSKVLQPYKDWLLLDRSEVKPKIGDKIIVFWGNELLRTEINEIRDNNEPYFKFNWTRNYDFIFVEIDYISRKQNDNEINEFIIKCQNWLIPLGYVECFSDNHLDISDFHIDFNGNGMRLCCRKRFDREECWGQIDMYNNEIMVLRTGNYEIETTELNKISENLNRKNENIQS